MKWYMQKQVKTHFEDMLSSGAASKNSAVKLTNPSGTSYNNTGTNTFFRQDALTAYTQAILYYVTGDNVYRQNAIEIFRATSQTAPLREIQPDGSRQP